MPSRTRRRSRGRRTSPPCKGTAAGGGYELALAIDEIILVDDGSTTVSLPEMPLLAVLPGTGGLTRLVDKRHVRRDRADVFCTLEEGIKGERAREWRLVDEVVPRTPARRGGRAPRRGRWPRAATARSRRAGIALSPLERRIEGDAIAYSHVACRGGPRRGASPRSR